MKSPLESLNFLDDLVEKDCHNIEKAVGDKFNLTREQFLDRYSLFFSGMGLATGAAVPAMMLLGAHGITRLGNMDKLATGLPSNETNKLSRKVFLFMVLFMDLVPAFGNFKILEILFSDQDFLDKLGVSLHFILRESSVLATGLYFHFAYGDPGEGLSSKVKNLVDTVLKPAKASFSG